ncbi:MAG: hypothetical protein M0R75_15540 [Dehalococcoidia bacterium]|nr:hypothetical protein [Dehalococcoidia bacterium]
MSANVQVYVEDIDDRIADDFDSIKLWRDTSPNGTFSTLVTTILLVADQTAYTYEDTSGDSLSWYRYAFLDSSTLAESDPSVPFRVGGTSLASARIAAAIRAGAGFASTCTSAGTTSTLIDAVLRDQGVDTNFLAGAWLMRTGAADADKVRRTSATPFTVASGTLAPVRDWSDAPDSAEAYQVYTLLPPIQQAGFAYSWDQAVRDGLHTIWFIDQQVVAEADGTDNEFDVSAFPWVAEAYLRRVLIRTTDSDGHVGEVDASRGGRYWSLRTNGQTRTLVLPWRPGDDTQVICEVNRRPDPVYQDADFIPLDEDLVAAAAVLAAFRYLNRIPGTRGQYVAEVAGALGEFQMLYAPPSDVVREA